MLKAIIIENTNVNMEQLDDLTYRKFDYVLNSEEALELGVIDEIL
jgi:ATP-dependent protease ClpP protease subunit